jgi:hypothetical protein
MVMPHQVPTTLLSTPCKQPSLMPGPGIFHRSARHGVSKGVEDSRRPPALQAGHSRNSHKAVSGVARPQGIEGLGMVGPGDTLGSPWIPLGLAIRVLFSIDMN